MKLLVDRRPMSAGDGLIRRWNLTFAVVFTGVTIAVPWPELWLQQNGTPLEDRRVYTAQIMNGFLLFDVNEYKGVLSYLSNEYLWGWFLNLMVRVLGVPLEVTFGLVSAFILFIACLTVTRFAPKAFALLLINPSFINLAFSQMRIGLAMALVCAAFLLPRSRRLNWVPQAGLVLASCLVHTSMAIFIGLFVAVAWVVRRDLDRWSYATHAKIVAIAVLTAVVLGPLRDVFLEELGDRRIDAEYMSSSFKFYVIWIALLLILSITWRSLAINSLTGYALASLTVIAVGLFIGVYVNRVLAISMPFLIGVIYSLPRLWQSLFVLAYLVYDIIYWFYWLNLFQ